jgi:polar amino acid transport system permease protein
VEDWLLAPAHYQRLWGGLLATLQLLGQAFVLGVVLSLVFGVGRLSKRKWVRGAALVYVEFARGISSVILLFIMVIAIPILFDLGGQSVMFWARSRSASTWAGTAPRSSAVRSRRSLAVRPRRPSP